MLFNMEYCVCSRVVQSSVGMVMDNMGNKSDLPPRFLKIGYSVDGANTGAISFPSAKYPT